MRLRVIAATCVAVSFLQSASPATEAGASLYLAKCASCHGNNGHGRHSVKAPSLVSEDARKLSDERLRDLIQSRANGEMERTPSHTAIKKRLTDDQIAHIIEHIRKMQETKN